MRAPIVVEERAGIPRTREPVTVGIPLAKGQASRADRLRLVDEDGEPKPVQVTPLNLWSDGSLKWVLIDTLLSVPDGARRELWLETTEAPAVESTPSFPEDRPVGPNGKICEKSSGEGVRGRDTSSEGSLRRTSPSLAVTASREDVRVDTGVLTARFDRLGTSLLAEVASGGVPVLGPRGVELLLADGDLQRHRVSITATDLIAAGPVRATVALRGKLGPVLEVVAEVSVFAGRGLIRIDLTVRNPRAAVHSGGLWDLGDRGSVLVRDISVAAGLAGGRTGSEIRWAATAEREIEQAPGTRLEIYQDSSGGERWSCSNHIDRHGRVPLSFRGYRVSGELPGRYGLRASPCLWVSAGPAHLGAAVPEFWQCFPKALSVSAGQLTASLWPGQLQDLHEIQGGEQKTHRIWLSVEAPSSIGWAYDPVVARSTPAHYVASGALPHLIEWDEDGDERLRELTVAAVDPQTGLAARRERIDEYGWRNFGDVWADHEDVGNEAAEPRVSHYNNQYDGCYGALVQFARSGDARWFRLADEMARHLADIDVYHTRLDEPSRNGGAFWHTDHYTDAGTCTHRCYTRLAPQAGRGPYGGGQSNEHLYATGMAVHSLMTGWRPSRESAISLADWAIDADDGALTALGTLIPGPTGLASRTIGHEYHGPGRGAGNVIATLLDALELTADERYLAKAEEIIRRCTHPDDDREAFGLVTAPEYRWSYTAYLVSLVRYLEVKVERGELDQAYAYGRAVLLSYARWMTERETLSSAKKELLDIWSETWPAQDLRKGLVLMHASRFAERPAERDELFERGRQMYGAAVEDLFEWDEHRRTLARPLFLVMRYGYPGSEAIRHRDAPAFPAVELEDRGKPSGFISLKGRITLAMRKAKSLLRR
jgi:hypothetical protein